MIKICFAEADGREIELSVDRDCTLMEAAVGSDVPGIIGLCGGECSCATCHVHVDPAWHDAVGAPNEIEDAMLDLVNDRSAYSRLACQVRLAPALSGLRVTIGSNEP